jgi:hypothetical protein
MGSRQKPKLAKSIHKRETCTTETGASSQTNAIGSSVSSRKFDGNDVEYEKK